METIVDSTILTLPPKAPVAPVPLAGSKTQSFQNEQTANLNQQQQALCSVPRRFLSGQWLVISRPQYQRTCGISSLISIWNYQFSRLGLGNKQPICIEQAMLKLNLIGNGSIQENMRKKFKKTKQLTQINNVNNTNNVINTNNSNNTNNNDNSNTNNNDNNSNGNNSNNSQQKTIAEQKQINNQGLYDYISQVDFGCFTGNDTLLKWYRLLCRIYGGSGHSYMLYRANSQYSRCKDIRDVPNHISKGLSTNKIAYIYHAHDHYFCPVGYEVGIPEQTYQQQKFKEKSTDSASVSQNTGYNQETTPQIANVKGDCLTPSDAQKENPPTQAECPVTEPITPVTAPPPKSPLQPSFHLLVGESSKMFPILHCFSFDDVVTDLHTYPPQYFNIRRRKEGVKFYEGREGQKSKGETINCIMAFEKIRD